MTNKTTFFAEYWAEIHDLLQKESSSKLNDLALSIINCYQRGGKTILVGNGGSAAVASHAAVDLVKAANIRAICFNESSFLTCLANDFGYQKWVEKALEFHADSSDLVVLISSSGQSENILNAARYCKTQNIQLVTFSGFESANPLRSFGNLAFWADSKDYNHVETVHQTWLLATIDFIILARRDGTI